MGYIEELQIAAAEADTYVGDAKENAEKAYARFNEGLGNVRAALSMLMMHVIDELDKANVCFTEAEHHAHETEGLVNKARSIIASIGFGTSSNTLAQAQDSKINTLYLDAVQVNLAIASIVGSVGSLRGSAEELRGSIGANSLEIEEKDLIPGMIEAMNDYRNDANEYLRGQQQ